ncbi:MAG: hypothetical protein CUN55_18635 [Phototrophicales bacterium]|nr:MAG: hypothetical protein CUN55_18635 [Phototrophicales bacterium]
MSKSMIDTLKKLREKVYVGVVSGSDFAKQKEQLGNGKAFIEWD